MGRVMPSSKVVTGFVLPNGDYTLEVSKCSEEYSRSGLLMFVVESRVVAPIEAKGKGHTEYFVIGKRPWTVKSDASEDDREYFELDDPSAAQEMTWLRSSAFKRLVTLLQNAEYDTESDMDADVLAAQAPGLQYGARIEVGMDTKEGSKYFGRELNHVVRYYKVGIIEPGIDRNRASTNGQVDSSPIVRRPARSFADD